MNNDHDTRHAIAERLASLRAYVDAEMAEIMHLLREAPSMDGARDFSIAVQTPRGVVDVEREADAIALAAVGLREALQPQHRGRIRKGVRKALGYYR